MEHDPSHPAQEHVSASTGPDARSVALLIATVCTTFYAGLQQSYSAAELAFAANPMGFSLATDVPAWHGVPSVLQEAAGFSLSLMAIIFAHEMGHYLTARKYGVGVGFPLFLPSVPPFGTLGAVIQMDPSPVRSSALMRVAVNGPFAGMIVAVPVLIVGVMLSEIRPLPAVPGETMTLGTCLLMSAIEAVVHGAAGPGQDLYLHPVAFAGWAGCFVTSLNLLPMGQLDGGHVTYSLWGQRRAEQIARLAMGGLVVTSLLYPGWLFFGLLVFFVIGLRHPEQSIDGLASGSDRTRGYAALVLFALTVAPVPIGGAGLGAMVGDAVNNMRLLF